MKTPVAILTETYKQHTTEIGDDNGCTLFTIVNPFWDGNIKISIDPDEANGEGIIFYFPLHHAHFDVDIDGLIEYINHFICGERVSVALYREDEFISGFSYSGDIDTSSGESILRSLVGDSPFYHGSNITLYEHLYENLKGHRGRCSIRGWNNADNKDIDFIVV